MSLVKTSVIACLLGTVVLGAPLLAFADDGSTTTTTTTDDEETLVAGGGACAGAGLDGLAPSLVVVGALVARRVRRS